MAAPRTAQERPNSPNKREGGREEGAEREEEGREVWREGIIQPTALRLPFLVAVASTAPLTTTCWRQVEP